jgi:ABC-2 type transport system ATP-binding protein
MDAIRAADLTKHYRVHTRGSGLGAAFKNLWHREFKSVQAVNAISFRIPQGQIVGFLGPNGAGKTTTLKMLSGLLHPTAGQAQVLGYTPWQRRPEYLKKIALIMGQKGQLWWDVPAMDSYLINKEIYEVSDRDFEQRLTMLSDLLNLDGLLQVQVRQLSLGERMKCELAGALLHDPQVLFLDEPTIGLDVTMQKRLRDFIKAYNHRTGATILLTSHYMDDIEALCERLLIIDQGNLIYDGDLAQIIDRYVDHRRLTVAFDQPVEAADLADIGDVEQIRGPRAIMRVPRDEVAARAMALLNNHDVTDLTIEEVPVEDIIRRIFESQTTPAHL